MGNQRLINVIERLRGRSDLKFEHGPSDSELEAIQRRFAFTFPPDLRFFLQYALPVSQRFPNWRSGQESEILARLKEPLDGIKFDIEHANWWLGAWGSRPSTLAEALYTAEREVRKAPLLVPVCGHRFIPAEPQIAGNPVFPVVQTDIVHYGCDLATYLINEFHSSFPGEAGPPAQITKECPRRIRFWDDLVDLNG